MPDNSKITLKQLKDAMMSTVARAEDGSYRKDGNGNYRETGGNGVNNKEFTNIIKEIDKVIQSGYGNYSKTELEDLKTFYNNADPKAIFSNFINSMSSALIDANGNEILSTQDLTKTIYGTVHTNGKSGAVNDERIKVGETFIFPYYSKIIPINNEEIFNAVDMACSPVFSIKDGQITWEYYPAPKYGIEDVKFMYGGSI